MLFLDLKPFFLSDFQDTPLGSANIVVASICDMAFYDSPETNQQAYDENSCYNMIENDTFAAVGLATRNIESSVLMSLVQQEDYL